ncbi:putative phage-related protein [Fulvivirga imtechensis AK7]|uniref:Putative phage-related protein n=1 Tax=Fulvivirga imtechensis AK7 TaxID=1237149 RepID=L8JKE2_9BACT|nr:hypothetical protein [Fulvivirga imtechensis]ELR67979.1 putative phage-related protein [Fulvivirga imtechensis AK7]
MDFWKGQENLPDYLIERVEKLNSNEGLLNDLFLINPFNEQPLSLRPNFAFFDFKSDTTPSQADVYFIIASIVHFARFPESQLNSIKQYQDMKFLRFHEHVQSVFSPECFNRFNDGIIQAAILRIANPNELNYSVQDDLSYEMATVLKNLFKNDKDPDRCEAILEFLLAIATGKLRLKKKHKDQFLNHVKDNFDNKKISIFCEFALRSQ